MDDAFVGDVDDGLAHPPGEVIHRGAQRIPVTERVHQHAVDIQQQQRALARRQHPGSLLDRVSGHRLSALAQQSRDDMLKFFVLFTEHELAKRFAN